jgi:low temperature requirement protein LtrA
MLEAALLFWMLWLPWTQLTWAANAVSAHSRNVQAIFLVATVTSVPMAAAVSTALDGAGFLFAGSVSIILAMGLVMLIMGHETGSAEWKSSITYAIPNAAAMILFLAGAAFDDTPVRVGFWIAGIGIIAFGTLLAAEGDWVVRVGHFAERHGLILIIALGEIIVSGVIVSAAALEEITLHPLDDLHLEFRIMLLIGLGMFFAGIELSALRAFHVVPIERAVAMAVLAALLLFGGSVDGLWLLGAIDLVILAALILEARRLEHHTDTARTD